LSSKDIQNLKKILEIVKNLPREKLLKDLEKAPGWCYCGPSQKKENKLGPARYADPTFIVSREDFDRIENWYHYPILPHYNIHGFLPCRPRNVVNICRKMLFEVDLPTLDEYKWTNNSDNYKISLSTYDEDIISGSGPNHLLSAYDLYREVCRIEEFMRIPSLSNMEDVVDVNTDWDSEPTLIFKNYPYEMIRRYRDFFDLEKEPRIEGPSKNRLVRIGSLKLVEDDFHILVEKFYEASSSRAGGYRPSKKRTVRIGGIISRLV
jgi:hypothetical protein